MNNNKLTKFIFHRTPQKVKFIKTMDVIFGVTCDVYAFKDDLTKDLGIITIKKGHKTPLQKVLKVKRQLKESLVVGENLY